MSAARSARRLDSAPPAACPRGPARRSSSLELRAARAAGLDRGTDTQAATLSSASSQLRRRQLGHALELSLILPGGAHAARLPARLASGRSASAPPISRARTRSLPFRSAIVLATRSTRCCSARAQQACSPGRAAPSPRSCVETHMSAATCAHPCARSRSRRHPSASPPGARARPSPAREPSRSSSGAPRAGPAPRRARDG